jgi:curved DNA-binding protein CbpA
MSANGYRDYFKVLGVERSADADAIKRAFRKLAREYHPDVNPGDASAEARFKEISEAYEVLSDPDKRRKYEQFGQYWSQMGGGTGRGPAGVDVDFGRYGNFDDFINDLLGRFGGPGGPAGGGGSRGRELAFPAASVPASPVAGFQVGVFPAAAFPAAVAAALSTSMPKPPCSSATRMPSGAASAPWRSTKKRCRCASRPGSTPAVAGGSRARATRNPAPAAVGISISISN